MRHRSIRAFSLLAILLATSAWAQTSLVSTTLSERNGLTRAWFAQVQLTGTVDKIAYVRPYVSSTEALTIIDVKYDEVKFRFPVGPEGVKVARRASNNKYFELRTVGLTPRAYPTVIPGANGEKGTPAYEVLCQAGKFRYSELDRDAFKKLLGVEGVTKKAAEQLKALEKVGVKAKLKNNVVPRVTLIVSTERGRIQAIDGETGRTVWSTTIGTPDHIVFEPSASDEYVVATSGVTVYLISMKDGQLKWKKRMSAIPGAGANISDNYVYVPMLRGRIEAVRIVEPRYDTRVYMSPGRVRVRPIFTSRSLAWPTEAGTLYVANANRKGMRYRLETGGGIHSEVSYIPDDRFVGTSLDGFVYCLQEQNGDIVWRFSTGGRLRQSAVLIGDAAYAVTTEGNLFCIGTDKGEQRWWMPYISKVLSASNKRLYLLDRAGRLVVVDPRNGGQLGSMQLGDASMSIVNKQTDRVYLISGRGMIQCLHEETQEFPIPHAGAPEAKQAKKPEDQKAKPPVKPAQIPAVDGANPFGGAGGGAPGGGGGANPFGGGGAAGGAGAGGANPFGGGGAGGAGAGGAGAGANPFGSGGTTDKPKKAAGAGSNPFGN